MVIILDLGFWNFYIIFEGRLWIWAPTKLSAGPIEWEVWSWEFFVWSINLIFSIINKNLFYLLNFPMFIRYLDYFWKWINTYNFLIKLIYTYSWVLARKFLTNDFVFWIINLGTHNTPICFFLMKGVAVMVLNYSFPNWNVLYLLYEFISIARSE